MGIKIKVYGKPLKKKLKPPKFIDKKAFLKEFAKQGKKYIRQEIDRHNWKHSPEGLKKSIKTKRKPSSVTFYSRHPGALYQNQGVRSHQMKYLLKAKRPIPLETGRGLIFRWATRTSMARGGWVHPGYTGKKFMQRGLKRARKVLMKKYFKIKGLV